MGFSGHAAPSPSLLLAACGWMVWTLPGLYPHHPWKFCEQLLLRTCLQYLWFLLGWKNLLGLPDDSVSALAAATDPTSSIWLSRPEYPPPALLLTHFSLVMAGAWRAVDSHLSYFPGLWGRWELFVQFIPYWFWEQPRKDCIPSLSLQSQAVLLS